MRLQLEGVGRVIDDYEFAYFSPPCSFFSLIADVSEVGSWECENAELRLDNVEQF
jgi:hypothetical protein